MIRINGEKNKPVSYVTMKRKGEPIQILTEKSDPKELYIALYELANMLNVIHHQKQKVA